MKEQFKLPIEFKTRWCAALRSGEYQQGELYLYDSDTESYCCLGVGEAIEGVDLEVLDGSKLPKSVEGRTLKNMPEHIETILTTMNDGEVIKGEDGVGIRDSFGRLQKGNKKSFLEIAEYIEQNL